MMDACFIDESYPEIHRQHTNSNSTEAPCSKTKERSATNRRSDARINVSISVISETSFFLTISRTGEIESIALLDL